VCVCVCVCVEALHEILTRDSNVPAIKAEKRINLRAQCGLSIANCAIEKGSGSHYPFAGTAVELVSNTYKHLN
jgi:hypothetical protein